MTPSPASSAELTPWFPGDVKPARAGVYERKYGTFYEERGYSRWDGRHWYFRNSRINSAAIDPAISINQSRQWRGLAHPPKGAK
jgi:hypothetical protein